MTGPMSEKSVQEGPDSSGNRLTRMDVDWTEYGKLGAAAVGGLAVNALILTAVTGGDLMGIVNGVTFMAPAVVLAVVLFHRHNPVTLPVIGPAVLFMTLAVANLIFLIIRGVSGGYLSGPITGARSVWGILILAVVALMFVPGPFLATYAARRWWL